jgi:hypothetical protein
MLQTQQAFGVLKTSHRCEIMILLEDQSAHKKLLLKYSLIQPHGLHPQASALLNILSSLVVAVVAVAILVDKARMDLPLYLIQLPLQEVVEEEEMDIQEMLISSVEMAVLVADLDGIT